MDVGAGHLIAGLCVGAAAGQAARRVCRVCAVIMVVDVTGTQQLCWCDHETLGQWAAMMMLPGLSAKKRLCSAATWQSAAVGPRAHTWRLTASLVTTTALPLSVQVSTCLDMSVQQAPAWPV